MSLKDRIAQIAKKADLEKLAKIASRPQQYTMGKLAETVGAKPGETSEASAQAIVERAAEALGVPETSTAGNVAKALAVAGLETFADPLGMVPVGKLGKLAKIVGAGKREEKVAEILAKRRAALPGIEEFDRLSKEAAVAVPKTPKVAEDVVRRVKAEEQMDVLRSQPTNKAKLIEQADPKSRIRPDQIRNIIKARK